MKSYVVSLAGYDGIIGVPTLSADTAIIDIRNWKPKVTGPSSLSSLRMRVGSRYSCMTVVMNVIKAVTE